MSPGGGGKIYWHLLAKNYTDATRVRFNVIDGVVDRPELDKIQVKSASRQDF